MGRPQKQVGHIQEDNTPNSFYRMLSISAIDLLAIPYRFHHTWLADDCLETIKLKTSTGCIWGVGLKEANGKIFMGEGWSEFVQVDDLKTGYFMVFRKLEARSLKVTIFNYKEVIRCAGYHPSLEELYESELYYMWFWLAVPFS
jgi:hypothetical protein